MAFRFSLEAVLRLRQGQERSERLKLEAIVSEQAQARANMEEITDRSCELHRQFLQQMRNGMVGSELQIEAERGTNVNLVCKSLSTRLLDLEQQRIKQLQIFLKVRQSREVLENLRLRKLKLYRIEQSRREQQELDDLFLMRQAKTNEE